LDSEKFIISGGKRLEGSVEISGAKNSALSIMAASLLTKDECILRNVPHLTDVEIMSAVIRKLGVKVEWINNDTLCIDSDNFNNYEAPYELVKKMRASILVMGPLLARLKKAKISLPGGCAIGARPVDFHIKGFEALGAKVEVEKGYIEAEIHKLKGNDIYLDFPSLGATENIMMAAVLANGTSVLRNAAREPEIVALAEVLNQMGADVQGAGTSAITINGVASLKPVSVTIIPDRIETGTFMVAAALTGGNITLVGADPDHQGALIDKLRLTGAKITIAEKSLNVQGPDMIVSVDVKTQPYPGFPTDMQAQFMVLMSIANGTSLISETIFENRFIHVSELKRMGADIIISGNTAMVKGVSTLSGAPVMATDLRASASLILAGLVAEGQTVVNRVYHLDRGYQAIEKKFAGLGAVIKRVK